MIAPKRENTGSTATTLEPVNADLFKRLHGDRSDACLVKRAATGDESALGELYDRYGASCFRVAHRITQNSAIAEEVVQEAFLALWRGSGYTERLGTVRAWLIALVHHKAVDAVRKETAISRREATFHAMGSRNRLSSTDPEAEILGSLSDSEVRSALFDLSPQQREAIVLAYFGGYSQREIAELTNVPLGTVKTRMFAGMRRLQIRLRDSNTFEPEEAR